MKAKLRPSSYRSEVILKLVRPTTGGTQCGMQAGEVLISAHLYESMHGSSGEADEVQVPCATADGQVAQLQVHITDAGFAVSCVGGEVPAYALQILHLLLLLLCGDVFWLEVNKLY